MAKDTNKHASIQDKKGVLLVKDNFTRIPYSLLNSEAFNSLSPVATRVYTLLLSEWKQHKYSEPVKMAIRDMQKRCPSRFKRKDKKGKVKTGFVGLNQLQRAIGELVTAGFITTTHKRGEIGTYYIDYNWFTGHKW